MPTSDPGYRTTEFWATGGLSAAAVELAQRDEVPTAVRVTALIVAAGLVGWYTWQRKDMKLGGPK